VWDVIRPAPALASRRVHPDCLDPAQVSSEANVTCSGLHQDGRLCLGEAVVGLLGRLPGCGEADRGTGGSGGASALLPVLEFPSVQDRLVGRRLLAQVASCCLELAAGLLYPP
jgi:hypothetical protein